MAKAKPLALPPSEPVDSLTKSISSPFDSALYWTKLLLLLVFTPDSKWSSITLRKSSILLKSLILIGLRFEAILNSPLTASQLEKWFFDA